MAPRLLSKAEFARLAGCSKSAITKALKGNLKLALVRDRIDIDHPAATAYLKSRGKAAPDRVTTDRARRRSKARPEPTDAATIDDTEADRPTASRRARSLPPPRLDSGRGLEQLAELPGYRDMTMRQLARRWGTFRVFADLLDALKTIEDIRKTHLHNEETEGSLISRDLVRASLFGGIESAFKRLLTDAPRTIAGRVLAMGKSGASVEEAERVVREVIGGHLKVVKATAVRVLRGAPANESDADAA